MGTSSPIGVIFDFDGTLTPKSYGSLIRVVEDACLSESFREGIRVIRDRYLAQVARGKFSEKEEERLIQQSLATYVQCDLKIADWQAALKSVRLRPGAAETIGELSARGIHIGIISFSVADFIERVLENNGLLGMAHRVYAARLRHNAKGRVTGFIPETVVYPREKNEWAKEFAGEFNIEPCKIIAVGDSGGDRRLGPSKELRLGIAEDKKEAARIAPYMGEVVVTHDFACVKEWINKKIGLILSG